MYENIIKKTKMYEKMNKLNRHYQRCAYPKKERERRERDYFSKDLRKLGDKLIIPMVKLKLY